MKLTAKEITFLAESIQESLRLHPIVPFEQGDENSLKSEVPEMEDWEKHLSDKIDSNPSFPSYKELSESNWLLIETLITNFEPE